MIFLSALLAADAAKAAPHAAPAHGAAESHGPVADIQNLFGSFGVDGPHLIVQIVNFSILALVLYQFAIKPALGQMEERNRLIEKGLADAQAASQRRSEAEKEYEAKLNAAADEAAKIRSEAHNSTKATVEAAKEEAAKIITAARIAAEGVLPAERAKMRAEVQAEVSRLVVETAAKVLAENLDDATRGRLNEAAVKQLAR